MIFEFTLKVKLTGVAVIVLEISSYVKSYKWKSKMGGGGGGPHFVYCKFCTYSHLSHIDVIKYLYLHLVSNL